MVFSLWLFLNILAACSHFKAFILFLSTCLTQFFFFLNILCLSIIWNIWRSDLVSVAFDVSQWLLFVFLCILGFLTMSSCYLNFFCGNSLNPGLKLNSFREDLWYFYMEHSNNFMLNYLPEVFLDHTNSMSGHFSYEFLGRISFFPYQAPGPRQFDFCIMPFWKVDLILFTIALMI